MTSTSSPAFSEPTRRPRRSIEPTRLAALTGIRAYCLAWVLVVHFLALAIALFPWTVHAVRPVVAAQLAVDTFFMLSGFVLAYNYGDELSHPDLARTLHFWGMRIARIYPIQVFAIFTWFVWALVEAQRGHTSALDILFAPLSLLQNLALLQYVWPGHLINPPSWSLGAEAGAYLLFPLLALLLAPLRRTRTAWVLGVLVVTIETIGVWHAYVGSADPAGYGWGWFRLGTGFLAGALYATGWKKLGARGHGLRGDLALGVGLLGGAVAILLAPIHHDVHMVPLAYPCVSLVVVGSAAATGPLGRMMCHRVAIYVGERSFSVYMLHYLCVVLATQASTAWAVAGWPAPARAVFLVGSFALTVAFGFTGYRLIERPARIRIRRAVDRSTGIQAAPLV